VSVGGNPIVQISLRDITRRKHAERSMRLANQAFGHSQEGIAITEERLLLQSTHDLLTDLPNRALFTERLHWP
jgi:GGDEF domain-containing protein